MKALIYASRREDALECLGFLNKYASIQGGDIEANLLYTGDRGEIEGARGLAKIFLYSGAKSGDAIASTISRVFTDLGGGILVSVSTKDGLDIICRASSILNIPMVTEVSNIARGDDGVVFERPFMGGRALARYLVKPPIAATIAPGRFPYEGEGVEPEIIGVEGPDSRLRIVEERPKERGAVDIEKAEIVVGVGRGFRSREDLGMVFELAKLINGEVGCTRPIAADYKWLDEDRWIGISGKKIRGKLYIAIGISGAPQHIMAANDTRIIVAINNDKNAPIFNYSDYGVVADLYQFIPALLSRLRERLGR